MVMEEWSSPDEVFTTDACLLGCGAWNADRQFFHVNFPNDIKNMCLDINSLALLTIIVACKVWGHKWAGKRLVVKCDNITSVLNSDRSKNLFLQSFLREMAFVTARHEFEVRGVHISGISNRIPDALSRWEMNHKYQIEFEQLVGEEPVYESFVYPGLFNFLHDW